jgi:ligand-binding sensor domain-containing protein/signal transduction histidine kinase
MRKYCSPFLCGALIASVILMLRPQVLNAQEIEFKRLSIENGLSQTGVNCVLQDQRGFMWFGTQDGLNMYDGYTFSIFRHDPSDSNSIADNYISSLFEDRSGRLWVGTYGGLNLFDVKTKTFERYQNELQNPSSLSDNHIRCIYADHSGQMWLGTLGGLNLFDAETKKFERYENDPQNSSSLSNNRVYSVCEDRSGRLWVGTQGGGLNLLDTKTRTFEHLRNDPNNSSSLADDRVSSIYKDRSGRLWVGTEGGGLSLFDPGTETFEHFKNNPQDPFSLSDNRVWSIYEDRPGRMWVGTLGGGLDLFDADARRFECYQNDPEKASSLSNNTVLSIYEDRSGRLWVGTGGGLNLCDTKAKLFARCQNNPQKHSSLSNNLVGPIYEDHAGHLWVGTLGGGLNFFETKTKTFEHFKNDPRNPLSLSSNFVSSIYEDHLGRLWVGTDGGLNLLDMRTKTFERYYHDAKNASSLSSNFVSSIYEDRLGRLWVGTYGGGLNLFDTKTKAFERYQYDSRKPSSLSSINVICIYEDRAGRLWVGTYGGLNLFDAETKSFERYQHDKQKPSSLSHDNVSTIYEDRSGRLWVGTLGGGLNLLNMNAKTFRVFREKDGLPNDVIYGILEDGYGRLWLSTNNGLSRFTPPSDSALASNNKGLFRNYDITDGLVSNEFNQSYFTDKSGKMYFGGIKGFNSFHPDSIRDDNYVPPIVLTGFELFNKPVEVGKDHDGFLLPVSITETNTLILSHNEAVFTLEFAALDFAFPEKNKYAYKLEGFDKDWTYTSAKKRYATYTHLDPGSYTFLVKGSNHDGIWNEKGLTLKITITPPLWKTWWAYTLYALIFSGCVAGFIRFQTRKTKIQAKLMIERQREDARVRVAELRALAAESQAKSQQSEIENAQQLAAINRTLAEKNSQLEILNDQMDKTVSIVRSLNSAIGLRDLLNSILEKTQAITHVKTASVLAWDTPMKIFKFKACIGIEFEKLESIELTHDETIERYVKNGEEIEKDIWVVRNITGRVAQNKFDQLPPLDSLLVVCLRDETQIEGYLLFDNILFSDLGKQDVLLLKNLKEHLHWAILKARLLDEFRILNDKKNEYLGIVAHDLRNPITAIMGYSEMLIADLRSGRVEKAELLEDLEKVHAVSKHMAFFISQLLDIAAIESGKVRLDRQSASIARIVQDVFPLHLWRAEQKGINLTIEPLDALPDVPVDHSKIASVVDNLLTNAIKYTYAGGSIRIYGESSLSEIQIHVKDTGQGLTPDDKKKVFATFTKLSAKPTGGESSTGLGLAIVKKIVEIHGGRVWVKSEHGKGSTFSFSLPMT